MGLRRVLPLALLILLVPTAAEAQYRGYSSKVRKAIDKLSDERVEQVPVPVLGVLVADLFRNFGDPRDGGRRKHQGLDIMAPEGTPIISPTDAVVTRVGEGDNSGLYVRTANPGGETFVYMHLSEFADDLSVGDVLEAGDLIGYVGTTGNAQGGAPHLHFEIRKGSAMDPFPRLTRILNSQELAEVGQSAGVSQLFARDLELGMEGEDVRLLQVFLNGKGFLIAQSGVGSPGQESDYFGEKTQTALARYQAAHKVVPAAGYFGPKTRAKMAIVGE